LTSGLRAASSCPTTKASQRSPSRFQ
jgi:hypothetical protein